MQTPSSSISSDLPPLPELDGIDAVPPGSAQPKARAVSRRRFLGGTVAAGGLVVAFNVPFPRRAVAQGMGGAATPAPATGAAAAAAVRPDEMNCWVVIQPDETVIIRVARSEMGQGTLTGLAQLVAEELECDWAKVSTEYPTPGQNLARNRIWGSFSTGGSRGVRESHDYVRKGGAIARVMLVQAAADGWKVPAGECAVAKGVITHRPSGRTTTYGKVCEAAAKLTPPTDVALKDPKDWKIAGQRVARLDTAAKVDGSQVYGMDLKLPGMLNAAIKACPVFGGKVKRFDAAAVASRPGVKKVRAGRRLRRRGGRRHLVAREDGARCAADRVGLRPERSGLERDHRGDAEGRPRRAGGDRRQPGRRRAPGARRGGAQGRGGLLVPVPEPRDDGGDERDGALDAGALRGLGADPERRGRAGRDGRGVGAADREVRRPQAQPRRRLRPARPARLARPGGRDRAPDAGHAGQADLVARGGHDARPLPPDHAVQDDARGSTPTAT